MKWILIAGVTSDIGKATAHSYAQKGYNLLITGRNINELYKEKQDLEIRYSISVLTYPLDLENFDSYKTFFDNIPPPVEGIICFIGYLGSQDKASSSFEELSKIVDSNYKGIIVFLNYAAIFMKKQRSGFIAAISSVAGDRGRKSNYIYGSAKAGLNAYLSGLRAELFPYHVHVCTVKPGFVDTKMTAHLNLPKAMTATPREVSLEIIKGIAKKQNEIYVKRRWKYVMSIINSIPEFIFKRLSI